MKRITLILLAFSFYFQSYSQTDYPKVVLETSEGKMTFQLYDNTPLHSENFTKLINEGYYNNQLFHRVIENFMIQAGDPESVNAEPGATLGSGGPDYTIPAEFRAPNFHKKGALAAARMGDATNPQKASSGSQFYIVQGQVFTDAKLDYLVSTNKHPNFTKEQREAYTTVGGTPHLDYSYTVFGELIDGMEVLDKIAAAETGSGDRPVKDVVIIKTYILK